MTAFLPFPRIRVLALLCMAGFALDAPKALAAEVITAATIEKLDAGLAEAKAASSDARQRLAVRRSIRDAQELIEANKDKPERFLALEFLFRAQQVLIKLDADAKHRDELMDTCRELVKAPDEYAHLKFQADLLLSQAELAKKGASTDERAAALRPIVERYVKTKEGPRVLRVAMVMALELGDAKLVQDLQEMIAVHYSADHEMINFQRDKLGGQVLGVPFVGSFKRSDGKMVRYPMDGLGRSLMVLFWSKDDDGLAYAKGLAEAYAKMKDELAGSIEIISINVDGLPDAGESIIRGFGADWQCLHLPGGRENPIYKAYVRTDPLRLDVSSTGQAALIMEGVARKKLNQDGTVNFEHTLGSARAREWTRPEHCNLLCSLFAGDFLVFDPEGFSAQTPPEWKALGGKTQPLQRTGSSVPEETLAAIQSCFVAPPQRYSLTHSEIHANYSKAVQLSRKAMADHAAAPDLWIVRNRLIIALMGLWKNDGGLAHLEQAVDEAKAAMAAGYPAGCDVVARFCIAHEALRQADADSTAILDKFIADGGGDKAAGPVHAAAAILALDIADRVRFEGLRDVILKQHTENPMMWLMTSWMLDRHHAYWLFQVPFTAGWSYGRRQTYFQTRGDAEPSRRILKAELRTADGKVLRIPEDLDTEYTAIFFAPPQPWSSKRDDGLPPSPTRAVDPIASFAARRPKGDVKVALAVFGDEPAQVVLQDRNRKPAPCAMLALPGGADNPLVHRLGMLDTKGGVNSVIIDRQGRVLTALSSQATQSGATMVNVLARQDELKVNALIDAGKAEEAKTFILGLAPEYDPEAVDERGRKLPPPKHHISHLRARARVYMALKEWDKALADAEQVCSSQLGTDGGMSLRTDELDESEALRDAIKKQMEGAK